MTPAEQARNQAISLEAKKDRLSQRQSSDWSVTFTIQDADMDPRFTSARMGTRYAMVLVEIGDDELPVPQRPAKETRREAHLAPAKLPPDTAPAGAKRDWRDMPKPQQAGIRINEPTFAAYLREEHPVEWRETGEADACLKFICRIHSKREFVTDAKAGALWYQIDAAYQAWLARERVGA